MATAIRSTIVTLAAVIAASCAPPSPTAEPLKAPTPAEAFESVKCSAVRPQTEPDLMAWDPVSRANLNRLRNEGLVAVRYEAKGCNVELELLSNCIAPGSYKYAPYSANETKIAKNANDLYAQLPVGAARLSGKLKGDRALRTDYMLVGTASVPPGTVVAASDLKGQGCERATHVVSAIYVGGFAMAAGESRHMEAQASVFSAGVGASSDASVERLDNEGNAEACKKAQSEGKESPTCSVPLRIGLLALDHRGPPPGAAMHDLVVSQRRLPNNVGVIVHEDHSSANVAVRVIHYAGSIYDPPGREGMAHLFEHLMFNATREADLFATFKSLGVTDANATTSYDVQSNFENVPTARLADVLAIEADRTATLGSRVDQRKLDTQRDVVKNEIMRYRVQPATNLQAQMDRALYGAGHPYARLPMGEPAALDAITVDEARRFFSQHHGGVYTIVVLAGDVDPEKGMTLVQAAFGSLPPMSATTPPPLASAGPTSEIRIDGSAAPDMLYVAWATPAFKAPGDAELDLAARVLSRRLTSQLVNGSYAAARALADNASAPGASSFRVSVKMRADHKPDEALRVLDVELAALREKGPTEAELAAAREDIDRLWRSSTNLTTRAALAFGCYRLSYMGKCADQVQARYAGITVAGVRDAVRALLAPGKRVIVAPAAAAPAKKAH